MSESVRTFAADFLAWKVEAKAFNELAGKLAERWMKDRCECGHTREYHYLHWPACKGFREAHK